MTDARERIAEIFKSTLEFDGVVYNADQTIDAILSALPSIVREMIPDLEFKDLTGAGYAVNAVSLTGIYNIRTNGPDEIWLDVNGVGIGGRFRDGDEAEKAANEHHKQQILKAMGMSE